MSFNEFIKSPIFENIVKKESLSLDIAFAAFYGSRNYGLETATSDYDFFIVYYPSFEDFYNQKFSRHSVTTEEYDYFIMPLNEYFRHAMDGNIRFIEPLFCNTVYPVKNPELISKIKKFISMNHKRNFNAITGMIKDKRNNIANNKYTSNTLKYKEVYGYDIKEGINSLRLACLLKNYIKTGNFDFVVKGNHIYDNLLSAISLINNKAMSKDACLDAINNKLRALNLLRLSDFITKNDESKLDTLRQLIEKDIINKCKTAIAIPQYEKRRTHNGIRI